MGLWSKNKPAEDAPPDDDGNVETIARVASMNHEGHVLALGLRWRALRNKEVSLQRDEARTAAEQAGVKFAATVESVSGRRMLGFVPKGCEINTHKAVSGASWLASSVTQHTIFVQQLDSRRWWLAMVRPGEIDINGDLIGGAQEIGEAVDQALTDAHEDEDDAPLDVVLCVTELPDTRLLDPDGPEVRHGDLRGLVTGSKPPVGAQFVRLRGVNPAFVWAALGIVALMVVVAVGWMWHQHRVEQRMLAEARRQAALASQRQQRAATLAEARLVKAVAEALRADTRTPVPSAAVSSMVRILHGVEGNAAGWSLQQLTWSNGSIESSWQRPEEGIGTNVDLKAYAERHGFDVTYAIGDAEQASVRFTVPSVPSRDGLVRGELPERQQLVLGLATWAQRFEMAFPGSNVTIGNPTVKAITYRSPVGPGQSRSEATPVPPGRSYRVGKLKANGVGLVSMQAFAPDWAYVTLTNLRVQVGGAGRSGRGGQIKWNVEAQYVVAP